MAQATAQHHQFKMWHKSTTGLLVSGLVELLLAYIVGSRALDTGSWWEYGFTLLLLYIAVRNLVQGFKKLFHG